MKIHTGKIVFKTGGDCEVVNVTAETEKILKKSGIKNGMLNVFIPGATGAVTTIEYEPGLVADIRALMKHLVKEGLDYGHNRTHSDGNATAHLRASLLGPSLTVPVDEGKMCLGVWQSIIFVDMDNRPRERSLTIKIIGE